jgi:hypothetical protein
LFLPVTKGLWQQHELWDGTYTFDDWWNIVELILLEAKNEEIMMQEINDRR